MRQVFKRETAFCLKRNKSITNRMENAHWPMKIKIINSKEAGSVTLRLWRIENCFHLNREK